MIDPDNRTKFELLGLENVSFTISHGGFFFAEQNKQEQDIVRQQALEWISEQRIALGHKSNQSKRQQDKMMRWTVVGAVAATIAAIASLLTLIPILQGL
jgi:hypothetical protein